MQRTRKRSRDGKKAKPRKRTDEADDVDDAIIDFREAAEDDDPGSKKGRAAEESEEEQADTETVAQKRLRLGACD